MRVPLTFGPRSRRFGLYAGGFLGPFGGGMLVVLIPDFRDVFGVSTTVATLSLTLYLVPYAALQLVSGTIGERLGRDRVLRISFLVYFLASIASVVVTSIAPFLAARVVQGVAIAFTTPLVLAKLAESTAEERLGASMGTYAAVQTAGMVMAPLIGGVAGALDYRLAFVAAAAAALVLAIIVPERGGTRPERALLPSFASAWTPKTAWLACASAFYFMCTVGIGVVVALEAADDFGVGAEWRGLLFAGFGLAGIVVGRPTGIMIDRVGQGKVVAGGVIGASLSLVALAFVDGAWALAIAWACTGGFATLISTSLMMMVVQASQENRAGAISVVSGFRFASAAVAPMVWVPIYHVDAALAYGLAALGVLVVIFAIRRALNARASRTSVAQIVPAAEGSS